MGSPLTRLRLHLPPQAAIIPESAAPNPKYKSATAVCSNTQLSIVEYSISFATALTDTKHKILQRLE